MAAKIILIVAVALVVVGAMFWLGKAMEGEEEKTEKKTPQE